MAILLVSAFQLSPFAPPVPFCGHSPSCVFALTASRTLRRFFNAEDAKLGAEGRRENITSATLCENLCVLCVEPG